MISEPRPLQHLRDVERDYGRDVWRRHGTLLEDVRGGGVTWPSYVHAPLAAAYAVISGGGDRRVPPARAADIGRLGALAAWRPTKGIYRWDPDLLDALWSTPLDRALPADVLTRLPEWCVYLDLEGRQIGGAAIFGAYVHLEHDANDGHIELRMLLDAASGLTSAPIHLVAGGALGDGARAAALRARAEAVAIGMPDIAARDMERRASEALEQLAPIISCALYLCTEEPDLRADDDPERTPARPFGRATGAQRVTTWDTGYRVGAALRWARNHRTDESEGGGVHASPVGHVRRAHWHAYWLGSEQRGDRRRELRWLAPILVGVDLPDELLAVVRRVKERGAQ